MSLICPACQSTYEISAAVLGPNGRKVRCASCGHTWMALPPLPSPPEQAAEPTSPAASADTQWEGGPQIKIIPPPENVFASYVAEAAAKPNNSHAETHKTFRPIETGYGARHRVKPDTKIMALFRQLFIPVSLAMLAILLGTLIVARSEIVHRAPDALSTYNFFGINPLPPGGGLAIMNVHDESRFGQLDNALVIHGDLINRTSSNLRVPLFKMEITSPTGQTKTFMARGPVEKIDAGAIVPFTLERAGFAAQDWDVKLTFGNGDERDTGKVMQSVDTPRPGADKEQK